MTDNEDDDNKLNILERQQEEDDEEEDNQLPFATSFDSQIILIFKLTF